MILYLFLYIGGCDICVIFVCSFDGHTFGDKSCSMYSECMENVQTEREDGQ